VSGHCSGLTLPTPPISSAAAGFRLHVVPDIIEEHQTTDVALKD